MAKMEGTQRFTARLEAGALGWTVVRVPFAPGEVWPERRGLRVAGEVNGWGFRSTLFGSAGEPGRYVLLVNRRMQAGAAVGLGEEANFVLGADLEERPAELPEELDALLEEEAGLRAFYEGFTEYARREMGKWIAGVKTEEARLKRAGQMAERLLATMEAEVQLPPAVERAFRAKPKARAGWVRMTAVQRRGELFAVFSYQGVEARERRIAKMCALAETKAP